MATIRMTGNSGFVDDVLAIFLPRDRQCMRNMLPLTSWKDVRGNAREILRRITLAEGQPDHMPVGRSLPPEQIATFSAWINEETPKRRGANYSSYFRDLDAVTEYFDVYGRPPSEYLMPSAMQYFGPNDVPGRRKALNIWKEYAVIPDDDPTKAAERQNLETELAQPEVREGVRRVDAVMLDLMRTHLASDGVVDADATLDAFYRFGKDSLPEDPDRLRRIRELGNENDDRLDYANFHRMDGPSMWLNWMGHVECAVIVAGAADPGHQSRTMLMAGVVLGYIADCVYRGRNHTAPEYYGADGDTRMWRRAFLIANDFDKARAEAYAQAKLQRTTNAALLAALEPPRFKIRRDKPAK